MSVVVVMSERSGIMRGQPPRMIVDRLLPTLDERTATVVTALSHFGYGLVAGGGAGVLLPRAGGRTTGGVVFGLALWAAGYEGWVPLIGALPPAHRDDPRRAITMILGHVVFGATFGVLGPRPVPGEAGDEARGIRVTGSSGPGG